MERHRFASAHGTGYPVKKLINQFAFLSFQLKPINSLYFIPGVNRTHHIEKELTVYLGNEMTETERNGKTGNQNCKM